MQESIAIDQISLIASAEGLKYIGNPAARRAVGRFRQHSTVSKRVDDSRSTSFDALKSSDVLSHLLFACLANLCRKHVTGVVTNQTKESNVLERVFLDRLEYSVTSILKPFKLHSSPTSLKKMRSVITYCLYPVALCFDVEIFVLVSSLGFPNKPSLFSSLYRNCNINNIVRVV